MTDGLNRECLFCKLSSTALLVGTSVYLGFMARRKPQHRLFLGLASGGMGMFAAANWILRQSTLPDKSFQEK